MNLHDVTTTVIAAQRQTVWHVPSLACFTSNVRPAATRQ